jgi:hypothetical protein
MSPAKTFQKRRCLKFMLAEPVQMTAAKHEKFWTQRLLVAVLVILRIDRSHIRFFSHIYNYLIRPLESHN